MQPGTRRVLAALLPLILAIATKSANATVAVDAPAGSRNPDFQRKLLAALANLERSDEPYIRQLYSAVKAASGTVTFRQMTDDRATWSNDGDPDRGHTEPTDGRRKREGRTAPTDATIFIPKSAVELGGPRWNSGLLVHELVHTLDLTTGRYNRDYTIRERRATFIQNVWRHRVGSQLRVSYHGKFATLDYQYALEHGTIAQYADYVFTRADFPKVPPEGKAGTRAPRK